MVDRKLLSVCNISQRSWDRAQTTTCQSRRWSSIPIQTNYACFRSRNAFGGDQILPDLCYIQATRMLDQIKSQDSPLHDLRQLHIGVRPSLPVDQQLHRPAQLQVIFPFPQFPAGRCSSHDLRWLHNNFRNDKSKS